MSQINQLGTAEKDGFDKKIAAKTVLEGVHLGDSIAVNGICLTVTEFDAILSDFTVGLSPETLRKMSLIELESGSLVNLERAVQPTSRMGVHFGFNFMLAAYTQQKVVIPLKTVGQKVNLGVDIVGKYMERLLSSGFVEPIKSS